MWTARSPKPWNGIVKRKRGEMPPKLRSAKYSPIWIHAMINGVKITPLKQIVDERGKVMHMLRSDSRDFQKFGEIYFSCVNPGAVKAWHIHKAMTLNYAVPHGRIKLVLYDDRAKSPTKGEIQEIVMGPDQYQLGTVPPLV